MITKILNKFPTLILLVAIGCLFIAATTTIHNRDLSIRQQATNVLRKQILSEAAWALKQQPITVTAESSSRSAGGKHDFYSEGDYWAQPGKSG